MPPISAVIITRGTASRLPAVLAAASRCCGECFVLSSGRLEPSLDTMLDGPLRVEFQPFLGYGPQKQEAVRRATHDWILSLDDDEILDDDAVAAIRRLDLSDASACWSIPRRTFVGDREIKYGVWRGDCPIRLFNRQRADFSGAHLHEAVHEPSRPRRLPGQIFHYSYDSTADLIEKAVRYAVPKARQLLASGEPLGAPRLPLRALYAFLKSYVFKGGFRDGADGLVVALSRSIDAVLARAMILNGEVTTGSTATAPERPGDATASDEPVETSVRPAAG